MLFSRGGTAGYRLAHARTNAEPPANLRTWLTPAAQYNNADLTAEQERTLLRRNYLLLMTGQAALGRIGPDILGIAVEPRPGAVVIHIAARQKSAEVAEDLADLTGDLGAFLAGGPEQHSTITTDLHIGQADSAWPGRQHALLYLAKTPGS